MDTNADNKSSKKNTVEEKRARQVTCYLNVKERKLVKLVACSNSKRGKKKKTNRVILAPAWINQSHITACTRASTRSKIGSGQEDSDSGDFKIAASLSNDVIVYNLVAVIHDGLPTLERRPLQRKKQAKLSFI